MKSALLLTFLLPNCVALAQDNAVPAKPATIVWNIKDPRCKVIYTNGVPRERFQTEKLTIDVWSPYLHDKQTEDIGIGINDVSSGEVDVDPRRFSAQANDAKHTLMPVIDADAKLAKEQQHVRRMQAIGAALSGFGAGMSSQTATVNNSDGSTSQVTYHDPAATDRVNADAAANAAATTSHYKEVSRTILRRNTLTNGGFVIGDIYLERPKGLDKKAKVDAVAMYLGGTVYIFPFKEGHVPEN